MAEAASLNINVKVTSNKEPLSVSNGKVRSIVNGMESHFQLTEQTSSPVPKEAMTADGANFYLSSLLNTWEDKLQCAICISPFKDPVALSCLHSFCQECISLLVKTLSPKKISCPTCRKLTILGKGESVEKLNKNFFIEDIYDKIRKCQAYLLTSGRGEDGRDGQAGEQHLEAFTACGDHQRLSAPYSTVCTQCIADLRAYFLKTASYVRVVDASYRTCTDIVTHLKKHNKSLFDMLENANERCEAMTPPKMFVKFMLEDNKFKEPRAKKSIERVKLSSGNKADEAKQITEVSAAVLGDSTLVAEDLGSALAGTSTLQLSRANTTDVSDYRKLYEKAMKELEKLRQQNQQLAVKILRHQRGDTGDTRIFHRLRSRFTRSRNAASLENGPSENSQEPGNDRSTGDTYTCDGLPVEKEKRQNPPRPPTPHPCPHFRPPLPPRPQTFKEVLTAGQAYTIDANVDETAREEKQSGAVGGTSNALDILMSDLSPGRESQEGVRSPLASPAESTHGLEETDRGLIRRAGITTIDASEPNTLESPDTPRGNRAVTRVASQEENASTYQPIDDDPLEGRSNAWLWKILGISVKTKR